MLLCSQSRVAFIGDKGDAVSYPVRIICSPRALLNLKVEV